MSTSDDERLENHRAPDKAALPGGVLTPGDWLHFTVALLCHDIGYVRGVCRGDGGGRFVIDGVGITMMPPRGATDAALASNHVARSAIFVRERFAKVPQIDCDEVVANIEHTRFPVPDGKLADDTGSYPVCCGRPTSSGRWPTSAI